MTFKVSVTWNIHPLLNTELPCAEGTGSWVIRHVPGTVDVVFRLPGERAELHSWNTHKLGSPRIKYLTFLLRLQTTCFHI